MPRNRDDCESLGINDNDHDPKRFTDPRPRALRRAVAWLNVPAPLSLKALRGKVVLLDFWTYGCINCIHILPDLKKLEARFPDELVVIGIHAAKFDNEKATENIRQIIRATRSGIPSPTTPSSGSGAPIPCTPGRRA